MSHFARRAVKLEAARLWLDWARADTLFGYVTLRSADLDWSETQVVPWTDRSWLGVEDVRQTIRRRVQSGNASIDPVNTGQ